jgi:polyhydroxyalkanoate synthesis regulator phasin
MEPKDIPYLILGAMSTARSETKKTVDDLIKKGQDAIKKQPKEVSRKGEEYISDLIEKGKKQEDDFVTTVSKEIQNVLKGMGLVTKEDVKKLSERIAKLEKKS